MRDTLVGDLVRLVSGHRILPYAEEKDPSLWTHYINHEKTIQMAHHGHVEEETEEELQERRSRRRSSETNSSQTTAVGDEQPMNLVTGHIIDKEKGRDINVVHWYGEDDSEASDPQSSASYGRSDTLTESHDMVQRQKVLRHSRDLFVDDVRLHRQRHIYAGNRRNNPRLWCLRSQSNPWSYVRLSLVLSNSRPGYQRILDVLILTLMLHYSLFVAGYGLGQSFAETDCCK